MNGVARWFRNVHEAVTSTAKGMAITARAMFDPRTTIQYPDVNIQGARLPDGYRGDLSPMSDRYRGFLHVDMDLCITCLVCEEECPIDCIVIEERRCEKVNVVSKTTGRRTLRVKEATRFDIDIGKCMYCGLCVEPCPTGAIHFTKEFARAVSDLDQLVFKFVDPTRLDPPVEETAAAKPRRVSHATHVASS